MQPEQLKAAGSGLVADGQPVGAAETLDEAAESALGRLKAMHLVLTADRRQDRGDDRERVNIQSDPQPHIGGSGRSNVRHGLVLHGRMRLWRATLNTATVNPRLVRRATASPHRVHAG